MSRMEITEENFAKVQGCVFVNRKSYSASAYQVTGKTRCYVRAREVPMIYIKDVGYKVDWQWIRDNPYNKKEGELYSLSMDANFIYRNKDDVMARNIADDMDKIFITCDY